MTDMPGRNLPASGLSDAIRNLTGIRCTTLVKLPVALSGGSRLNCEPLAGAMLSTIALIDDSREGVDADLGPLADRDMGELGFLVVRDDPDIVERHDGDDLASRHGRIARRARRAR